MLKRLPLLALAALVLVPALPAEAQVTPPPGAIPGLYGPAVHRGITFFLRYSTTTGPSEDDFPFGNPGDRPLLCDWDGSGFRQLGVHRGNTFHLETTAGVVAIAFGNAGDQPICGDWDGDGVETIGVRRGNQWFLSNGDVPGAEANITLFYGDSGDTAFVGDWDADGVATPGIRRGITFYLRNANSTGVASLPAFNYGNPTDVVVAADWDGGGDSAETIGIVRAGAWHYKVSNAGNSTDGLFHFGNPGDTPLVYREDA